MAENSNTLTLTLQFKEDGSIVIDQAKSKIQGFGKETEVATSSVDKMNKSVGIIAVDSMINLAGKAKRLAEEMYRVTRQTAAAGDAIKRQAEILNMTTNEYQRWTHVAYRADVETVQFATGIKLLSKNMYDAAAGSQESIKAFNQIGVTVTDEKGILKEYGVILEETADRFSRMKDGPEKVAKALDIFGRSGEAMIPFLNKGKEGIKEFTDEFKTLGLQIDPGIIDKLARADEQFEKFEAKLKSVKTKGMAPLVEITGDFLELFTRFTSGENLFEIVGSMMEEKQIMQLKSPAWIKDWVATYAPRITSSLNQNRVAAEAFAIALEKAAAAEVQMNPMFASDADKLKMMANDAERVKTAYEIMKSLGVKTVRGAGMEIDQVTEKFKTLISAGFMGEDLTAARKKLEEELNTIQQSYSNFTTGMKEQAGHWEEIPIVIGTKISGLSVKNIWGTDWRWVQDISVQTVKAQDELFKTVERKTKAASEELKRMQDQIEDVGKETNKISEIYDQVTDEIIGYTNESASKIKAEYDAATNSVSYSFGTMSDYVKKKIQEINMQLGMIESHYEGIRETMLEPIDIDVSMINRQSPEKPFTDKLNEIEGRLSDFNNNYSDLKLNFSFRSDGIPLLDQINQITSGLGQMSYAAQIASIDAKIASVQAAINTPLGIGGYLVKGYYGALNQQRQSYIQNLEAQREAILTAQLVSSQTPAPAPVVSYGGGSVNVGGVSINIGTIVIEGADIENIRDLAQNLDRELAYLWVEGRSRLRLKIQEAF